MAEQNKVDGIIALTYDPKLEVPRRSTPSPSTGISAPTSPAWHQITTQAGGWPPKS